MRARQEQKIGQRDDEWQDLGCATGQVMKHATGEVGRTEDRPTPMRTPSPRSSHQRNAPTRPAAPVPDAK